MNETHFLKLIKREKERKQLLIVFKRLSFDERDTAIQLSFFSFQFIYDNKQTKRIAQTKKNFLNSIYLCLTKIKNKFNF